MALFDQSKLREQLWVVMRFTRLGGAGETALNGIIHSKRWF